MYDATRVPSPKDGVNAVAKPVVPGSEPGTAASSGGPAANAVLQANTEDGQPATEEDEEPILAPVLVKKPHREILDHERKRRVELKCMELQEMMEEQGYTEEEIRQKVSTFRQMLMDKEGVITREGSHTQPVVNHFHYQPDDYEEDPEAVGYQDGDYEQDYHCDNRTKRKSTSSPSPRPKKRKKKKSGRRRSQFGSSSPTRREKKKKSGKKHKRDRSASVSRKKRRYRPGSQKNKHKDKNKQKKRSPGETPSRSSQHQGSCCSSRSASLSSTRSTSKSPSRLNSKHKTDGQKASATSPPLAPNNPAKWHNGDHTRRSRNGKAARFTHADNEKGNDLRLLNASSAGIQSTLLKEQKPHSAPSRNQAEETGSVDGKLAAVGSSLTQASGRRSGQRGRRRSSHSPDHSSDSANFQHNHAHRGRTSRHQRKTEGGHSSKRRNHSTRGQVHHKSPSVSPGRHSHTSGRKTEDCRSKGSLRQRSSSWSSDRSSSHSASRDKGHSKAKSPHSRQNISREKDSANRSDTDSRARRRSRSYSPIRKRRRDSPSFMEARRITSARKRPIPYYRPSPSSSSYDSSPSRSSRSRSYSSYSSYSRTRSQSHSRSRSRSRNWSRSHSKSRSRSWSRSRSRSRSHHSYYSRSSYDSPGF
ncbi:serine/arginine repetitive matrix protein 3 isoform X2 [Fundulus heteroclitus]|uniref:serine/arginine repetitive matrix protein 3 isoform X2 n=1 Tax=Fundulus heteroclitus TaxID=8078 RepID=UPI00165ABF37|nr:serine/arginine repetitive matrix protein 3 isoform X2 [Fundulus heteroclitus]